MLNYVVTPKARLGINSALRKQTRAQVQAGEEILKQKLALYGLSSVTSIIDKLFIILSVQ